MRFLHPEFLFLLGLIPLLALWRGKRGAAGAVRYSSVEALKAIGVAKRSKGGRMMAALRFLGLAALVVALARPQLGNERTEVQTSGVDIVLALDVSSSMEAMDFELEGQRVNRLAAVKGVVAKFIEGAAGRPDRSAGVRGSAVSGEPHDVGPRVVIAAVG